MAQGEERVLRVEDDERIRGELLATKRLTGRVPLYRRLSLRLAIPFAVTLLVYEFAADPLYSALLLMMGHPSRDTMFWTGEDEELESARKLADILIPNRESTSELPDWDSRAFATMDATLRLQGEAFVVLDSDSRIRASSTGLPWSVGDTWTLPKHSHSRVDLATGSSPLHALYVPLGAPSNPHGFFIDLIPEAPENELLAGCAFSVDADGARLATLVKMSDDEYERLIAREEKIAQGLSVAFRVAIALLFGIAISRWITRRLSRLSEAAAAPVGPDGEMPGPFAETGNDEISLLARTMNTMRGRVGDLVDGMASQDAERRQWVAQVSHDLRTPLTALLACLDRAERLVETDPDGAREEMRKLLPVARMDAERVQALTDDLLEIARLDANDALVLEPVPPGELVRQTVLMLGPIADGRQVRVNVDVSPGLPILDADGRRLMRAMENLLTNAIHHAHAVVGIRVTLRNDAVRFEVVDDGDGFPGSGDHVDIEALGKLRSRADSAGLGLVVTRKIAEAHGGSIGACNPAGGGAAVWFDVPIEAC